MISFSWFPKCAKVASNCDLLLERNSFRSVMDFDNSTHWTRCTCKYLLLLVILQKTASILPKWLSQIQLLLICLTRVMFVGFSLPNHVVLCPIALYICKNTCFLTSFDIISSLLGHKCVYVCSCCCLFFVLSEKIGIVLSITNWFTLI